MRVVLLLALGFGPLFATGCGNGMPTGSNRKRHDPAAAPAEPESDPKIAPLPREVKP